MGLHVVGGRVKVTFFVTKPTTETGDDNDNAPDTTTPAWWRETWRDTCESHNNDACLVRVTLTVLPNGRVTAMVKPRNRLWTMCERTLALAYWRKCMKSAEAAATRLRHDFPTIFGAKTMLAVLTRNQINNFVRAEEKKQDEEPAAKRGRPVSLPESVVKRIIDTLSSVISSRGTCWSRAILRPVALGVIHSMGYSHVLKEGEGVGRFACSVRFISRLLKRFDFRRVKPHRDTRKVPKNGKALVRDMALRVAYFVFTYAIPRELSQNWDQSGIMMLQQKGSTWAHKSQSGDTQHYGDKRQFTGTFGSTAAGAFLPCQIVFEGKTVGSLGKFKECAQYVYKSIVDAASSYGGWIFPPDAPEELRRGVGHLAVTKNHWSNAQTSIDLVDHVAVPAYLEEKKKLGLPPDHPAIILFDVWWGWLDPTFLAHIKTNYPWLKVCYVPACCTPIGQPQDGGTIAKVKASLRQMFNSWVLQETLKHMDSGKEADTFELDLSAPTMKTKLTLWLAKACAQVPESLVVKTWENTGLLRAWDPDFQREAVREASRLFPNMSKPDLQSATAPDSAQMEADPTIDELNAEDMPPTEEEDARDTVVMLRELGVEVPDVSTNEVASPWGLIRDAALGSLD